MNVVCMSLCSVCRFLLVTIIYMAFLVILMIIPWQIIAACFIAALIIHREAVSNIVHMNERLNYTASMDLKTQCLGACVGRNLLSLHVIKYVGTRRHELWWKDFCCLVMYDHAEITAKSTLILVYTSVCTYTHIAYVDHMHIVVTWYRNFNKLNQILDFRKLVLRWNWAELRALPHLFIHCIEFMVSASMCMCGMHARCVYNYYSWIGKFSSLKRNYYYFVSLPFRPFRCCIHTMHHSIAVVSIKAEF